MHKKKLLFATRKAWWTPEFRTNNKEKVAHNYYVTLFLFMIHPFNLFMDRDTHVFMNATPIYYILTYMSVMYILSNRYPIGTIVCYRYTYVFYVRQISAPRKSFLFH